MFSPLRSEKFYLLFFMNETINPFQQSENRAEKEKHEKRGVGFLFGCQTVKDLERAIDSISAESELDLAMLDEYDLTIEDVLSNTKIISELAKKHKLDIVMAPAYEKEDAPWSTRRNEIIESGAKLLDEGIDEDEIRDSIGYFFDKDGNVYAFPKAWGSIHLIPNTKTAVAICGEIGYLKPEQFENLDINLILNPSKEDDDPCLHYRMMGFFNPNITDDEIHAELRKNRYLNDLAEGRFVTPDYSHLDEHSKTILEEYDKSQPMPSTEELKQEYQDKFNKIKAIIKEQGNASSMYVKKIRNILEAKKIIVLRCDGPETTGILNPSQDVKIDSLEYAQNYYKMSIDTKE